MNITSGIVETAKKVVIYGVEGIGKTTLAAKFPDPLFIDTEGGTKTLDVKRFDAPTSWEMLLQQIDYTIRNRPCKTLVIDTVDWAERLCIEALLARYGKKGIEDFGYGNGYTYEAEDFGRFLNKLNDVIAAGINIVLVAHAVIRKFEQPDEMGAYDRYELKLGKKTTNQISPMVKEWADMILFCNYKTISVAVDENGKKHKAQGGRRTMYTAHHPCWDAKNRYELPDEIPMDYNNISHIFSDSKTPESSPELKNDHAETMVQNEPTPSAKTLLIDIPDNLPQALKDLMAANGVRESEIRNAVSARGYFPPDMPVSDYPSDFVSGVLIGAWHDVYEMIKMNRDGDMPF